MELDHATLCKLAAKWLLRPFSAKGAGCHISLIEVGGYSSGEIADAWGHRYDTVTQGSVLVEVKVSRADFLADAKKPHRNGETVGVGDYRYYMCPEGVITLDDLPHGWGLLWVNSRGHVKLLAGHVCLINHSYYSSKIAPVWAHPVNRERELMYVAHALNRIGDAATAMETSRQLFRLQSEMHKLENENRELKSKLRRAEWKVAHLEKNSEPSELELAIAAALPVGRAG